MVMGWIEQLEQAEERLSRIMDRAGSPTAYERYLSGVTEGLLSLADDLPESAAEIDAAVAAVLRSAGLEHEDALRRELGRRIGEAVDVTKELYGDQVTGIDDMVAAHRRSQVVRELEGQFGSGLRTVAGHLREATAAELRELGRGALDREALERRIAKHAGVAMGHAGSEARAVVSAYHQSFRDRLADEAELDHFMYYGHLQQNSRPFCRVHVGQTFTSEQLNAMDNGMLNPVRIHRGGYRCTHSLVPVDPAWDEVPAPAEGMTARTVKMPYGKPIRVYATRAGHERLADQMKLGRGWNVLNAVENDRGWVGMHQSWTRARGQVKGRVLDEFQAEYEAGRVLSELGHVAVFDRRILNNHGGAVDVILDGLPMEIKTPVSMTAASGYNRLAKSKNVAGVYQSEAYILNLTAPLSKLEHRRLSGKISKWKSRHPEMSVYFLHNYGEQPLFEEL